MKLENKLEKWNLNKWKKEFDKVFAVYIKDRDKWTCFTCGKYATGLGMNNGHYIPRGACGLELYFSEDNCHAQCFECNLKLEGNRHVYKEKLGEEVHNKLYEIFYKRNGSIKWDKIDYANKIEEYLKKTEELRIN